MVLIARQSELEGNNSAQEAFLSIQKTAENALRLIDSYLLIAQSEYGQRSLALETIGVGSVIYDVASDLTPYAQNQQIDFSTSVKDANVMANREGLKAVIRCLSEIALADDIEDEDEKQQKVRIYANRADNKVSIAVLSSTMNITDSDVEYARKAQGVSHLALGNRMYDSGIRLAIADMLAVSIGSKLRARKIDGLRGLGFELLGSKQMRLV